MQLCTGKQPVHGHPLSYPAKAWLTLNLLVVGNCAEIWAVVKDSFNLKCGRFCSFMLFSDRNSQINVVWAENVYFCLWWNVCGVSIIGALQNFCSLLLVIVNILVCLSQWSWTRRLHQFHTDCDGWHVLCCVSKQHTSHYISTFLCVEGFFFFFGTIIMALIIT